MFVSLSANSITSDNIHVKRELGGVSVARVIFFFISAHIKCMFTIHFLKITIATKNVRTLRYVLRTYYREENNLMARFTLK